MAGLELLWNSVQSHFVSKNDALFTIIHSLLLKDEYKCLGTGEKFQPMDDLSAGSELLPQHWNRDQSAYVLRYKKAASGSGQTKKLVVKAIAHNSTLIVSFLETPGDHSTELDVNSDKYLTKDYREFSKAFVSQTSFNELSQLFKTHVTDKLSKGGSSPKGSPKSKRPSSPQRQQNPNANRRIPQPQPIHGGFQDYDFNQDLRRPAPPIGGADLDPFGGGLGGMIMDPRDLHRPRPGQGFPGGGHGFIPGGPRLPPGAIPPGARFDPFGPPPHHGPRPDRYRYPPPGGPGQGPNPDHERPPDYDDMFM